MGIEDEIREIGERLHDRSDVVAEKISSLAGRGAEQVVGPLFALMRKVNPIVSNDGVTIVALNADVKEVLGDPARFTVGLYGPKMEAITGPFILGVDDTPLYHHDHAAMDRAVRAEDLPAIANRTYGAARELVSAARAEAGEIDLVT
ncbi:MAG: cytochrome P450, partial [Actinomycetota bacterium]|nr:cytochrome P450 [Actinomycetota bacterium]